jgi:hypothetical protein
MGGLSEIGSVLWEEGWRGSHGNDLLSSLESILPPASKLVTSPLGMDRSSGMASVL